MKALTDSHRTWWHGKKLNVALCVMASTALSLGTVYSASAQYGYGNNSIQGKTIFLPIGTTFEGRIDTTISSRSKEGSRFLIEMSSPVLANGSDVVIPAGSQVIGEVVEAIPSAKQPHEKHTVKPNGKLRVQLNGLRTPDGTTYPLVASLAPEFLFVFNQRKINPTLGGGIGYIGSQQSFNMAAPRMRKTGERSPVMRREDLMKEALYGKERDVTGVQAKQHELQEVKGSQIRSLVVRNHELFIDRGSAVSVQLDAPLKIVISGASGSDASYSAAREHASHTGSRRFAKEDEAPPAEQLEGAGLPFLPPAAPTGQVPQQGGSPGAYLQPPPVVPLQPTGALPNSGAPAATSKSDF